MLADMGDSTDFAPVKELLSLYVVNMRCGQYGGYAIALAYGTTHAAALVNDLTQGADCRDAVRPEGFKLLAKDLDGKPMAYQVWDGYL